MRTAILEFKMNRQTSRAAPLAGLLLFVEEMGIDWASYDLCIPVPLHNKRLRWRGYNQCSLLLAEIARKRKIQWTDRALIRHRDTRPQFELSATKRRENVKGAFACPAPGELSGKTVLLVDDITTTGATLHECVKVLKKAGVAVVDVAVLAKAGVDSV